MESMKEVFSKWAYWKSMLGSDQKGSLQSGFLSQGERDPRDDLRFLPRGVCGYWICPTGDSTPEPGRKPLRAWGIRNADTCQGCGLSEKGPEKLLNSPQNSWVFRRGEKLGETLRGERTGLDWLPTPPLRQITQHLANSNLMLAL